MSRTKPAQPRDWGSEALRIALWTSIGAAAGAILLDWPHLLGAVGGIIASVCTMNVKER
jgi:hypothetical protein